MNSLKPNIKTVTKVDFIIHDNDPQTIFRIFKHYTTNWLKLFSKIFYLLGRLNIVTKFKVYQFT